MIKILIISLVVLTALTIIMLLMGCRPGKEKRKKVDLTHLVKNLQDADFFKYLRHEEIEEIKQDIQKDGFLYPESLKRYYFADAEDLAERGVLEFIAKISPFLKTQNIHIPLRKEKGRKRKTRNPTTGEIIEIEPIKLIVDDSIPDDPNISYIKPIKEDRPESGDYYTITVGEFTQEIWNSKMTAVQYWEAGMCHTFILINKLLEKAESQERIYGLYGGNDGDAVFLTSEQFNIIKNSSEIDDADKPWIPYEVKAQ